MATEAAARKFFAAPYFAVVGASSNPAKYGHKVHAWYIAHGLDVTPVNPGSSTLSVLGKDRAAIPNLSALPHPKETAVSIVTAPSVTLAVLREARDMGVPSVWMQPGAFDDEVVTFATAPGAFENVVWGNGGAGHEGWCVLMDGERVMKEVGRL